MQYIRDPVDVARQEHGSLPAVQDCILSIRLAIFLREAEGFLIKLRDAISKAGGRDIEGGEVLAQSGEGVGCGNDGSV